MREGLSNLVPGTVLENRYRLHAELGEGGFGVVYEAEQLATGQAVAVKVLDESCWDDCVPPKILARFHREMRLCAQLHHANIVRLIDFGYAESGPAYAVYEFAPGKTLYQVLKDEGALPPREVHHLMLQVLDALACAHSHGIVHRDLKPSNIMVIPSGARRNAMVLDFGIGTLAEGEEEEEAYGRITSTNELLGTPSYMAPEQLRGARPMPRTDLFAWGLIFIECLTGQRVVSGTSLLEVMVQHFGSEPMAIPEQLRRHPVGGVLERVLTKTPELRDVTAAGLLREIEELGPVDLSTESPESARVPRPMASTITCRDADWSADGVPQVSWLCVLVDISLAGLEPADLEPTGPRLRTLLERCMKTAHSFDGRLCAVVGDRALFCFDETTSETNHAARAMQAAVSMLHGVDGAGWSVADELRIGIEAGPMSVLGSGEPCGLVPMGGTSALVATRLASAAAPGSVAMGPRARGLVPNDGRVLAHDFGDCMKAFIVTKGAEAEVAK